MTRNRSRLSILGEELDNLPMVAMRLGFPPSLLSPRLREIWNNCRSQIPHPMGQINMRDGEQQSALPPKRKMLAVTDGKALSEVFSDSGDVAEDPLHEQLETDVGTEALTQASVEVSLPPLKLPKLSSGSGRVATPGRQGDERENIIALADDVSGNLDEPGEGSTTQEQTLANALKELEKYKKIVADMQRGVGPSDDGAPVEQTHA